MQQMEAFKTILPQLGKRHSEIIEMIINLGGNATIQELSSTLKRQMNQISGRLTELCQKKIIKDSGNTRVNPISLRHLTVWELNMEAAIEYLGKVSKSE